jgi:hypothetical protein
MHVEVIAAWPALPPHIVQASVWSNHPLYARVVVLVSRAKKLVFPCIPCGAPDLVRSQYYSAQSLQILHSWCVAGISTSRFRFRDISRGPTKFVSWGLFND